MNRPASIFPPRVPEEVRLRERLMLAENDADCLRKILSEVLPLLGYGHEADRMRGRIRRAVAGTLPEQKERGA